jgi:hypothetical protein
MPLTPASYHPKQRCSPIATPTTHHDVIYGEPKEPVAGARIAYAPGAHVDAMQVG